MQGDVYFLAMLNGLSGGVVGGISFYFLELLKQIVSMRWQKAFSLSLPKAGERTCRYLRPGLYFWRRLSLLFSTFWTLPEFIDTSRNLRHTQIRCWDVFWMIRFRQSRNDRMFWLFVCFTSFHQRTTVSAWGAAHSFSNQTSCITYRIVQLRLR